jgi:hypothetical protein
VREGRLLLLAAIELVRGTFALGEVGVGAKDPDRSACGVVDEGHPTEDLVHAAVVPHDAVFEIAGDASGDLASRVHLDRGGDR